jgi:RNA polymerase sigma-70 factor (ECF subfamily)
MSDASSLTPRLLSAAINGESESLGQLLQLYCNYLKLMATTQLDQKLRTRLSPSDIVQETLFEAHRDFHQFRGASEGEFLAWLRRILVNNLARMVERHVLAEKRDVRREVSLEAMGASLERSTARLAAVLAGSGTSPSSGAERHEHGIALADELAKLPPHYREVIVLRHIEGLPFNVIADRMNRSSGAVRMLWMRSVAQLREQLEQRGVL